MKDNTVKHKTMMVETLVDCSPKHYDGINNGRLAASHSKSVSCWWV